MPRRKTRQREEENPRTNTRVSSKVFLHFEAKNESQEIAYRKLRDNVVTFLLGPAGTGKTYLAICFAISELMRNKCDKIILTRPAIEAGNQRLGFLPGSFEDKLNPYLVPLFSFLVQLIGKDRLRHLMEEEKIEIAPMGFLRGRNINGIVILDEAQNCTKDEIKMILTRIEENSKVCICGDQDQSDIPIVKNRLNEIATKLSLIESIDMHMFKEEDIVRNPIIKDILNVFKTKID